MLNLETSKRKKEKERVEIVENIPVPKYKKAFWTSRIKAFTIDMILICMIYFISRCAMWPIIKKTAWGPESFTEYYISQIAAESNSTVKKIKMNYLVKQDKDQTIYYRKTNFIEACIDFNINYPFLFIWLYFAIFWSSFGASAGQLISGNMVFDDFKQQLDFQAASKRSLIFIISFLLIIPGFITMFTKEEKMLYDDICGSNVYELTE